MHHRRADGVEPAAESKPREASLALRKGDQAQDESEEEDHDGVQQEHAEGLEDPGNAHGEDGPRGQDEQNASGNGNSARNGAQPDHDSKATKADARPLAREDQEDVEAIDEQ